MEMKRSSEKLSVVLDNQKKRLDTSRIGWIIPNHYVEYREVKDVPTELLLNADKLDVLGRTLTALCVSLSFAR